MGVCMISNTAERTKAMRIALLSGAVFFAAHANIAMAAETGRVASETGDTAEEAPANDGAIVVTARKREENLQEVPLAITAYSGEQLQEKGIANLSDLAAFTPGLAFQDVNGAYAAPVLRGIAQIDQTSPQGNVGVFIDGVYMNNRSALAFDQYDLSRIEVVKGPQSALYGRNTFAGAINYVTNEPKLGKFGGSAQFTVGNYSRYEAKGSLNVPLGDSVAVRVFGGYSEFDGTIMNVRSGKRLDGWKDRWSLGGQIKAEVTDRLTLNLFGVHSETKNDQPALYATPTTQNNCGSTTTVAGNQLYTFFCGQLPYPTTYNLDDTVGHGLSGWSDVLYGRLNLEGDAIDVSALVSYTKGKHSVLVDTTGNPAALTIAFGNGLSRQLFTNAATNDSHDWNYDLRFSSKADQALTWMIGVNHYSSLVEDVLSLNFQTYGETAAPPPVFSSRGGILQTKGMAVYGALGYEFSPSFNVQAELRYAIDDQTFNGTGAQSAVVGKQTFKYATPRFSVNWKASDDVLVYATAARGVKTGGFNANASTTPYFTFGPETNWSYEGGVKTSWLGGALTVNADVFYVDWRDIHAQTQIGFSTLSVVDNNGNADIKGIEGQIAYNVTRNFQLTASGALLDPKYKGGVFDGEVAYICGQITGSTVTSSDCSAYVDGNQIARTTKKQFALSGSWTLPDIIPGVDGSIRADYSWQAGKYSTSLNMQEQGAISLLNMRAGLKFEGFDLAVWAKNLLDEKYIARSTVVSSTADGGPTSGVSYTRVYPGQARTWGVELTAKF